MPRAGQHQGERKQDDEQYGEDSVSCDLRRLQRFCTEINESPFDEIDSERSADRQTPLSRLFLRFLDGGGEESEPLGRLCESSGEDVVEYSSSEVSSSEDDKSECATVYFCVRIVSSTSVLKLTCFG